MFSTMKSSTCPSGPLSQRDVVHLSHQKENVPPTTKSCTRDKASTKKARTASKGAPSKHDISGPIMRPDGILLVWDKPNTPFPILRRVPPDPAHLHALKHSDVEINEPARGNQQSPKLKRKKRLRASKSSKKRKSVFVQVPTATQSVSRPLPLDGLSLWTAQLPVLTKVDFVKALESTKKDRRSLNEAPGVDYRSYPVRTPVLQSYEPCVPSPFAAVRPWSMNTKRPRFDGFSFSIIQLDNLKRPAIQRSSQQHDSGPGVLSPSAASRAGPMSVDEPRYRGLTSFNTESDDFGAPNGRSSDQQDESGPAVLPPFTAAMVEPVIDQAGSSGFASSGIGPDDASAPTGQTSIHDDRASQEPPRKRRKLLPPMLRDLLPHNDGPDIGVEHRFQFTTGSRERPRLTRDVVNVERKAFYHEPLAPKKSLNLRKLMKAQVEDDFCTFHAKIPNFRWSASQARKNEEKEPRTIDPGDAEHDDDDDVQNFTPRRVRKQGKERGSLGEAAASAKPKDNDDGIYQPRPPKRVLKRGLKSDEDSLFLTDDEKDHDGEAYQPRSARRVLNRGLDRHEESLFVSDEGEDHEDDAFQPRTSGRVLDRGLKHREESLFVSDDEDNVDEAFQPKTSKRVLKRGLKRHGGPLFILDDEKDEGGGEGVEQFTREGASNRR